MQKNVNSQELQPLISIEDVEEKTIDSPDIIPNEILSPVKIIKAASPLAVPLFFNFCVMGIAGFGTAVIFANQNANVLAASPYLFALQTLPAITGAAIHSVRIVGSQAYGEASKVETNDLAGNNEQFRAMGSILRNGQLFGIVLNIPPMILIATIKPIIEFLGCPQDIAQIVQDYGDVFIWSVPITQLALASKLFIESLGKTKITLLSDVLGVGILLSVGGILSYGAFGIRGLGVQGMAYASILQFATIALTGEIYLFGKRARYGLYHWKESLASRWGTLKRLMKVGYPFIFLATGQIAANYVNLIMVTQFGVEALSAQNIAFHYKMLLGIPMISFCQSASILLGQAKGAGHYLPMRGLFDTAACGALLYSATALSVFMLLPDEMTSLFLAFQPDEDNAGLQSTLQPLYIATFIGLVEEALLLSGVLALNSLGRTPLTTAMGLGSRWLVSLPFSALLGFALNWGVVGIMLGEDVGLLVAAISMLCAWIYQANQLLKKNVDEKNYQQLAYVPKVVKKIEKLGSTCKPIWCSHFQAVGNKPNNRRQAIELINADVDEQNDDKQILQEQNNTHRKIFRMGKNGSDLN